MIVSVTLLACRQMPAIETEGLSLGHLSVVSATLLAFR
jgi:hypothetical protein